MAERYYAGDLAYIHAQSFEGLAQGAAPHIVQRLRSAPARIHRVLDIGCGAGPLTAALAVAGFDVTGIDVSAGLLEIARDRVPQAKFIHASVYDLHLPACDAIVAAGEPLTYHEPGVDAEARVRDFFRAAAAVLPVGGMLIFDLIETGEPSLAARTWRSGGDWAVLVDTEERSSHLTRTIETFRRTGELYRRGREVHFVRVFDTPSLMRELSGCGFACETSQSYGAQPLPPRRRAFFCTRTAAG